MNIIPKRMLIPILVINTLACIHKVSRQESELKTSKPTQQEAGLGGFSNCGRKDLSPLLAAVYANKLETVNEIIPLSKASDLGEAMDLACKIANVPVYRLLEKNFCKDKACSKCDVFENNYKLVEYEPSAALDQVLQMILNHEQVDSENKEGYKDMIANLKKSAISIQKSYRFVYRDGIDKGKDETLPMKGVLGSGAQGVVFLVQEKASSLLFIAKIGYHSDFKYETEHEAIINHFMCFKNPYKSELHSDFIIKNFLIGDDFRGLIVKGNFFAETQVAKQAREKLPNFLKNVVKIGLSGDFNTRNIFFDSVRNTWLVADGGPVQAMSSPQALLKDVKERFIQELSNEERVDIEKVKNYLNSIVLDEK